MTNQNDAMIILKALEKQSKPLTRKISDLTISTQDEYNQASKLLKELKEKGKEAAAREAEFTTPLNKLLKDIKQLFRPFISTIGAIESDTKEKMIAFVERQKKEAARLEQAFEDGKIKKVSTLVAKQAALEINSKYSQVRKVWTAVPVDLSKTPKKYMIPDNVKIREALKNGETVPGWEWKQIEHIAV